MSPLPSDSIKEVPGRSKLRLESSNPVPRGGNLNPKTSKVKLISPEEAMRLSSGANQMSVSPKSEPPRPKPARASSEVPKVVTSHRTPEPQRHVPVSPISEPPRPKPPGETPAMPEARVTSETPRLALVSSRREIVCGLQALSLTSTIVRQRTNPSHLQSQTLSEPPSPRALQIRSRIKQREDANATRVVEGPTMEVVDGAKDHDSKEIPLLISDEEMSELLPYRPALHPTWKGRIVDSAMPPEFDCEFLAKPASNICRKAHRLSKAMPTLLNVEMLPIGHVLNMFDRTPRLSNVEIYLFPNEKKTERLKGDHTILFEAMATLNAMIKVNINGTELLIFSSKLLDKTSQFIINTQRKTENFLWGCFLQNKNSQPPTTPGTSYQTDKDLDDVDAIDMDLDTYQLTPSLVLKLAAGSEAIPTSSSPENVNKEGSFPPGFEKIWAPPLVKLNIQATSDPLSDLTGYAGLVRYQSGKWMFGYFRCHKNIPEVAAGLYAIYQGLKILWDSGFRRIKLETSSIEIIDALTTNPEVFLKTKSILGVCKDMILKEWECEIYHISKEENLCAEWLAKSRLEEEKPQGLVFYEYPPRGLVDLLEKDRLAANT